MIDYVEVNNSTGEVCIITQNAKLLKNSSYFYEIGEDKDITFFSSDNTHSFKIPVVEHTYKSASENNYIFLIELDDDGEMTIYKKAVKH